MPMNRITDGVASARRFTGVGELERTGYIPPGSAVEREGDAGVPASGNAVRVCPEHDAACAEVPPGMRCKGCTAGVQPSDGGQLK